MNFNGLINLPAFNPKGNLNVIIETPKGSRNKFKFDPELGVFRLKKILPPGAVFPFDFGFVPGTLGDDGDPLDVLLLLEEPAFPGCLVPTRIVGVIEANQKQAGKTHRNDRLIAVASAADLYCRVQSLRDLNPEFLDRIEHFFISYNQVEGKVFKPLQTVRDKAGTGNHRARPTSLQQPPAEAKKMNSLTRIAKELVAPGKGILAADESTGTIEKRLKSVNVPSTEENRRIYRELLFTTAGLQEHISGIILFDETLRQKTSDGVPFPEFLFNAGIVPGIKVDKGAKGLAHFPGEKITEGLDGLRERFAEYARLGAKFAKWRAVISIGEGIPKNFSLQANAHALARYAALAQEAGLVPIVEPEVLMTGSHSIERCFEVTEAILELLFDELFAHRVRLEELLLKPSMVISGEDCPRQAPVRQVAEATLLCLRETVPAAVPGIVFLSGGQSDQLATAHLNAMNEIDGAPWELSFSFGRALQSPALKMWRGQPENFRAAQEALLHRAELNSAARFGKYSAAMEHAETYAK